MRKTLSKMLKGGQLTKALFIIKRPKNSNKRVERSGHITNTNGLQKINWSKFNFAQNGQLEINQTQINR